MVPLSFTLSLKTILRPNCSSYLSTELYVCLSSFPNASINCIFPYPGFDRVQLCHCLGTVCEFPLHTDVYVLAMKGDSNWRRSGLFMSEFTDSSTFNYDNNFKQPKNQKLKT